MKKLEIYNSTDENVAAATGHTVAYVKKVKKIREGVEFGDSKLTALATGFTENYVHMVLCFRRRNDKILRTLQRIQRNRAKLLADSPRFETKITHQLNEH